MAGLLAAVAIALPATLIAGSSGQAPAPPDVPPPAFYAVPARPAAAPPGTLLRTLPLRCPGPCRLWAIVYHSRTAAGADTLVSGLVAAPAGRAPPRGYPLVSWGHQTTGFTAAAAPSRGGARGAGPAFAALVPRGYAVAATDYQGLGIGGPPAYEDGPAAAHAVLDAARAARTLLAGRLAPALAIAGHSEGGHAALWAGQLQPSYARELPLRAVIASAPGANLAAALAHPDSSPNLEANVLRLLAAWHGHSGLPLAPLLTDAGRRDAAAVAADQPPPVRTGPFFRGPLAADPALARLLAANTPGAARTSAPILMLVGTADQDVPPQSNLELARTLRARGDTVTLDLIPGADHNATPARGLPAIGSFLARTLG